MKRVVSSVTSNTDNTYYGKFLQNEEKIRNLASADPNSYAVIVVKAMDHFIAGQALMKDYSSKRHDASYVKRILKEFSASLTASEIFAIWTPDLQRNVKRMAKESMDAEGRKISNLDRYARICYAMLTIQSGVAEASKFLDASRQKYPEEYFFHRVYCYLFTFVQDWNAGLTASDEVAKLFPNDANILNARAVMLRMMTDTGDVDYINWSRQKKQIDIVKEAFRNYLKVAPKDHRHFADNQYFMAYLSFKYASPSSQMSHSDMQDINVYFQNGLNAELDIIPCFLPFTSEAKEMVAQFVTFHPSACVYIEGDSCTIDMTTHGMPGRPKPKISTENMTLVDMRKPTKR